MLVALTVLIARTYGAWDGPFLDFEVRLPKGILLPDGKNIQVTLWSEEMGRGCGSNVRRAFDPVEIAGRCNIFRYDIPHALSVRLSGYAEGYWDVPLFKRIDQRLAFGRWQLVEFTWAPAGPREVSSLPYGEYYTRYRVRP